MASPLLKMHKLINDNIGFTYVATFQGRSEVVILHCTEKKNLTKNKEGIKLQIVEIFL